MAWKLRLETGHFSYELRPAMTTAPRLRKPCPPLGENAMKEEPIRRPKTVHEIGSDLSLLSVGELKERITVLNEEIARLEAVVRSKESSKDAASTFFKR